MQMDARRRWMYGERRSPDFIAGLHKFLVVAEANKEDGFMPCPCVDCRNGFKWVCASHHSPNVVTPLSSDFNKSLARKP